MPRRLVKIKLAGLHSGQCVTTVRDRLAEVSGVTDVYITPDNSVAYIYFKGDAPSIITLIDAAQNNGVKPEIMMHI